MIDIYREVLSRLRCGKTVALATVVRASGSTPREPGAKMAVAPDGSTVGTVGGGWGEAQVIRVALEAIRDRRSRLVHVEMNGDTAADSGAICGGNMDVFVEPLGSRSPYAGTSDASSITVRPCSR